jgi:hypothetical protein
MPRAIHWTQSAGGRHHPPLRSQVRHGLVKAERLCRHKGGQQHNATFDHHGRCAQWCRQECGASRDNGSHGRSVFQTAGQGQIISQAASLTMIRQGLGVLGDAQQFPYRRETDQGTLHPGAGYLCHRARGLRPHHLSGHVIGFPFIRVVRLPDRQGGALRSSGVLLLQGMDQFMSEQAQPDFGGGGVLAVAEHDVVAHGEGTGLHLRSRLGSRSVRVDPHPAQVGAKPVFKEPLGLGRKRTVAGLL